MGRLLFYWPSKMGSSPAYGPSFIRRMSIIKGHWDRGTLEGLIISTAGPAQPLAHQLLARQKLDQQLDRCWASGSWFWPLMLLG